MVLKDRFTFDTTGADSTKLEWAKKAIAMAFDIKNPDGTLDISDGPALMQRWQEYSARELIKWAHRAHKYETELAGGVIDISDM